MPVTKPETSQSTKKLLDYLLLHRIFSLFKKPLYKNLNLQKLNWVILISPFKLYFGLVLLLLNTKES